MLIHFLNVNYKKIITPPLILRAWTFKPMFSWIKIILKLCYDGIKYWLIFLKFTIFVLNVTFQSQIPGTSWATLFLLLHFNLYSISLILYNFSYLWSLNDTISFYVALKQKGIMTHTCVHLHCNSAAMNVVFGFFLDSILFTVFFFLYYLSNKKTVHWKKYRHSLYGCPWQL